MPLHAVLLVADNSFFESMLAFERDVDDRTPLHLIIAVGGVARDRHEHVERLK